MASEFVTYAIDKLLDDEDKDNKKNGGSVIIYKKSEFKFVPIDYVNSQKYEIRGDLLDLAKRIVNQ